MPDIFKWRGEQMSGETVVIPDAPYYYPPVTEPDPDSQPEPDEAAAEVQDADTDWEPTNTPQPEPEPEPYYEPPRPVAFTPALMTREELSEYYRDDLEQIYQDAAQRGYSEAFNRKKGELNRYLDSTDQVLAEMQQHQALYMEGFAKELKYMALEIAEKMICTKIDQEDGVLNKLVLQTVAGVKNAGWIEVELSERLVGLISTIQKELERPEYHGRAIVSPRAVPDDTVRVTTEDGTVVSTISTQAKNLREAFCTAEQT